MTCFSRLKTRQMKGSSHLLQIRVTKLLPSILLACISASSSTKRVVTHPPRKRPSRDSSRPFSSRPQDDAFYIHKTSSNELIAFSKGPKYQITLHRAPHLTNREQTEMFNINISICSVNLASETHPQHLLHKSLVFTSFNHL